MPVEGLFRKHFSYKSQVESDAWMEFIKKMTPNDSLPIPLQNQRNRRNTSVRGVRSIFQKNQTYVATKKMSQETSSR